MNIIIIGAGYIGRERIKALEYISNNFNSKIQISAIYDLDPDSIKNLKQEHINKFSKDLNNIDFSGVDWVFISLPHFEVKNFAIKALKNNCNLFIEKPMGRNLEECKEIISNINNNQVVKVGFNYRFMPGISKAISDIREKKFGNLISIDMTIGHGNSPGMEDSWKLNLEKCGGGCILDPGIHLIDLVNFIADEQVSVLHVNGWSGFWNTNVEEEAYISLKSRSGIRFNITSSIVRWRSTFEIKINGTEGYGIVTGRGRSYGSQNYIIGKKWGWLSGKTQKESEELIIKNADCENSFIQETCSALEVSNNKLSEVCDYKFNLKNMSLLNECYMNLKK